MFLENMTGSELWAEYKLDLRELKDKAAELANCKEADKIRRICKSKSASFCRPYTTSRKNQYFILMVFQKGECGWDSFSCFNGWINSKRGHLAISFDSTGEETVIKYTPHFFKRYKQRHLPYADWRKRNALSQAEKTKEIAMLFFRSNPAIILTGVFSEYGDVSHLMAPIADGVAMLQWDNREQCYQANTFISHEMLNFKQKNIIKKILFGGKRPDYIKAIPHVARKKQDEQENQTRNFKP